MYRQSQTKLVWDGDTYYEFEGGALVSQVVVNHNTKTRAPRHLTIFITSAWKDIADNQYTTVEVKIHRFAVIGEVLKNYARIQQLDYSSICFLINGRPISEIDTPRSLGLKDHDLIDCVPRSDSSSTVTVAVVARSASKKENDKAGAEDDKKTLGSSNESHSADEDVQTKPNKIRIVWDGLVDSNPTKTQHPPLTISIIYPWDNQYTTVEVQIGQSTKLGEVLKNYAQIQQLDYSSIRFLVNDRPISEIDTPEHLALKNGAEIYCVPCGDSSSTVVDEDISTSTHDEPDSDTPASARLWVDVRAILAAALLVMKIVVILAHVVFIHELFELFHWVWAMSVAAIVALWEKLFRALAILALSFICLVGWDFMFSFIGKDGGKNQAAVAKND